MKHRNSIPIDPQIERIVGKYLTLSRTERERVDLLVARLLAAGDLVRRVERRAQE